MGVWGLMIMATMTACLMAGCTRSASSPPPAPVSACTPAMVSAEPSPADYWTIMLQRDRAQSDFLAAKLEVYKRFNGATITAQSELARLETELEARQQQLLDDRDIASFTRLTPRLICTAEVKKAREKYLTENPDLKRDLDQAAADVAAGQKAVDEFVPGPYEPGKDDDFGARLFDFDREAAAEPEPASAGSGDCTPEEMARQLSAREYWKFQIERQKAMRDRLEREAAIRRIYGGNSSGARAEIVLLERQYQVQVEQLLREHGAETSGDLMPNGPCRQKLLQARQEYMQQHTELRDEFMSVSEEIRKIKSNMYR